MSRKHEENTVWFSATSHTETCPAMDGVMNKEMVLNMANYKQSLFSLHRMVYGSKTAAQQNLGCLVG